MKIKNFPPNKIRDLDKRSSSNFVSLLRDSEKLPVVLVFGSGVSSSAGLPIWNELLRRICACFFYHWEFAIKHEKGDPSVPPKNLSIAFFEQFFISKEAKLISKEFIKRDPLLVAQQVKNCIRETDWRYLLNKVLYNKDLGDETISHSILLEKISDYCSESQFVKAIINYNYDNNYEQYFKDKEINYNVIWKNRKIVSHRKIAVYHPHGYLPLEGGPVTKIILAENDYQQEATEPYSWANLIQTHFFSNSLCIFIGVSMTDPNLRRLLRVSSNMNSIWHYAFLPKSDGGLEIKYESLFDVDLQNLRVKTIRFPKTKGKNRYSRLPELIDFLRINLTDKNYIWES